MTSGGLWLHGLIPSWLHCSSCPRPPTLVVVVRIPPIVTPCLVRTLGLVVLCWLWPLFRRAAYFACLACLHPRFIIPASSEISSAAHVCFVFWCPFPLSACVCLWRVSACGLVVAFVSAEGVLCVSCRSALPVHHPCFQCNGQGSPGLNSAAVWVYYHRHRSPPSAAWVVAHMCFVLCFPFFVPWRLLAGGVCRPLAWLWPLFRQRACFACPAGLRSRFTIPVSSEMGRALRD